MKMTQSSAEAFTKFYQKKSVKNLYPTEIIVRMLLGTYPNLNLDKTKYAGSKLLDLGFGDGRNFPLLDDLDFKIHGVELSENILTQARERFADMKPTLALGHNASIPFEDSMFDYVLACHSCYYMNKDLRFDDNLREITRVLKPGGEFIFTVPRIDNILLKGAKDLGDGHYEIQNDPYNLRNGTVFRAFADDKEIVSTFSPYFKNIRMGHFENDYFGIFITGWNVVATRV